LLETRGALARPPAGGGAASEPPLDASWLADHGWI